MADLRDIGGPGGLAGWAALIGMLFRLLWDAGDRYEKKLAASILSCPPVKDAVGSVALAAVLESKEVVLANIYEEQRKTHDVALNELKDEVKALRQYVQSDQLPRAIAAAIRGGQTRRDSPREG